MPLDKRTRSLHTSVLTYYTEASHATERELCWSWSCLSHEKPQIYNEFNYQEPMGSGLRATEESREDNKHLQLKTLWKTRRFVFLAPIKLTIVHVPKSLQLLRKMLSWPIVVIAKNITIQNHEYSFIYSSTHPTGLQTLFHISINSHFPSSSASAQHFFQV